MSIRLKLIIMFLAVALIPLFLVSILTFTNYKNSLETNRLAQLQDLATFKADKIETYFNLLKIDAGGIQNDYVIKKNLPVLTRLANDPVNPEFRAARQMLDAVYQKIAPIPGLVDIMLAEPSGKVVYSSNPEHSAQDFLGPLPDPGQKAFTEGKDKIYLSEIFRDKALGNKPAILVTAPAVDFNGAFIGVIGLEVDMAPMYKIIQDVTGLGNTGETLVGKLEGNQVVYLNPLRYDQAAALERQVALGGALGGPIQEAVQGRTGSGQLIDYRGEEVIAVWKYLPSLGWGMVAKIDTKEAFADVANLRNLVLTILGLIIILSGIMAFTIAQAIAKPIQELSKGAEIIGTGNLDYKVAVYSRDEIGQLARSFDRMTQDLKAITASRDELNQEIAERKRAEKELRENEDRLKRSQEIAHLGSWELDLVNNRLSWSDEVYRIFGLKPQEFAATYEAFLEAVHPDDRKAVDEAYSGSLREGRDAYEIEHRVVRKSTGEIRVVHEKCAHLRDEFGRIVRSIGMVHDITERHLIQKKLRDSETSYRRLFEAAQDGILILDAETGQINDVNPFLTTMLGYSHNELLDKKIWDIGPFKDIVSSRASFKELQKEGYIRYEDLPLETKDGRHMAVEFVSNVYLVDHKKVIQCNIRDITERKRLENVLRDTLEKSQQRQVEVQALLTASRAVAETREFPKAARAVFDACKDLLGATAGYVALLKPDGMENEIVFLDAGGSACTVDPALPMPIRGLRAESYRTGRTVYHNSFPESDWVKFLPAGHVRLNNVLFAPLNIEGKALGLLGLGNKPGGFTDNDARLATAFGGFAALALLNSRTMESLAQSEERFRSVAQTAGDAIISADRNGRIEFWNEAAQKMFGYSGEELAGKSVTVIIPERFQEAHRNGWQRFLATNKSRVIGKTVEVVGVRRGGDEFPAELSLATYQTREDRFFTGIIRDITERKRAEVELKRYQGYLEDEVEQKSLDLLMTQKRLSEAERLAVLGQLSAGIVHEINNPLYGIANYLEILTAGPVTAEQKEHLGLISQGVEIIKKTTSSLLDLSQVNKLELSEVDINQLLNEIISFLKPRIEAEKAAITTNLRTDLPLIKADKTKLKQVFLNILINALEAVTEPGKIEIKTAREGNQIRVSLADNGCGIPPDKISRIFEPFVSGIRKKRQKGIGLGLFMAANIISAHKGKIDVTSAPGKGTTFIVTLPLTV